MTHRLFEDPPVLQAYEHIRKAIHSTESTGATRQEKLQSKIYESSTVAGLTVILDFHKTAFNVNTNQ